MTDDGHGRWNRDSQDLDGRRCHDRELPDNSRRSRASADSARIHKQASREELITIKSMRKKAFDARRRPRLIEGERQRLQDEVLSSRRLVAAHEREQERLQRWLAEAGQDIRCYSDQFVQLEQEINILANLHVASRRLHETLDRQDVIDSLKEIVINLVGAEEMGLFEMDAGGRRLNLLDSNGIQPEPYRTIPLEHGLIGSAAQTGELCIATNRHGRMAGEEHLTAAIPLKLGERVTGLIAIFRLLPQKNGFETLDRELFGLLASHAAIALYCTALHARLKVAREAIFPGIRDA